MPPECAQIHRRIHIRAADDDQEAQIEIEHLNAAVSAICHVDFQALARGDPTGLVELSICPARRANSPQKRAIGRQFLDAVIPGIGHKQIAGHVEGQAFGVEKLPIATAYFAKNSLKAKIDLHLGAHRSNPHQREDDQQKKNRSHKIYPKK